MSAGVVLRIALRHSLSRASVIHSKQAHRPGSKFAGKTRSELRLNNVVGVIQAHRRHEIAAVFDEEGPNLSKVGRKALIWRSRIVHAHLAEIRIDGGIEHQAVVQDELCVQARCSPGELCPESTGRRD